MPHRISVSVCLSRGKTDREETEKKRVRKIDRERDFFIEQEKTLKSFLALPQQRASLHEVHGSSVEKGQ